MRKKINNIDDLREHLTDSLTDLKDEKIGPDVAMAISKLAGKVLESARLQLEYVKQIGAEPSIEFIVPKISNENKKLN